MSGPVQPGVPGRGRRRDEEPPTLGSLSRPPDAPGPAPRTCAACGSSAVTQLAITLTDGTPVAFVSCQTCEHRSWFGDDGTEIPMADVLARSRREK